jgi:hypothetical protein
MVCVKYAQIEEFAPHASCEDRLTSPNSILHNASRVRKHPSPALDHRSENVFEQHLMSSNPNARDVRTTMNALKDDIISTLEQGYDDIYLQMVYEIEVSMINNRYAKANNPYLVQG